MAEFVSAILGLAAIGASAGNSLYSLVDTIKDAPNEFLALSNEVTDFRLFLSKIEEAWEAGQLSVEENKSGDDIDPMLKRGGETLKEVETLVKEVARQKGKEGQNTRIRRIQWLRRSRKAKKLQEVLRVLRSSLSSLLVAETLASNTKIGLALEGLRADMKHIISNQDPPREGQDTDSIRLSGSQDMGFEQTTTIQPEIGAFGSNMPPPMQTFHEDPLYPAHTAVSPVDVKQKKLVRCSLNTESLLQKELQVVPTFKTTYSNPQTFLMQPEKLPFRAMMELPTSNALQCFEDCKCRCHYRTVIRSPRGLSNYLGDLFVGYSSLPWCFSSLVDCNEQTCRRSKRLASQLRYFFPPWFMRAVASFNMSFSLCGLPLNIRIQTRTTIPYDSPIFICIQEGDIDGMKNLLLTEMASLSDIDPYGLGLLYYATYYGWRASGRDVAMKTCRTLLDIGAHADWEDEIGNTPEETMVDDVLMSWAMENRSRRRFDLSTLDDIGILFGKCTCDLLEDYIESRSFTTLHGVLLGIDCSHGTLEDYLCSFADNTILADIIDIADSTGRTALAWAVEYGWADAVQLLLKSGANPHQLRPSVHGKSPLLHLVIAGPSPQRSDTGFLDVIRTLLRVGVDVNGQDHEGWTPLHVAASWNLYIVVKELARYGGHALDWEAKTNDGQSALDLCRNGGGDEEVVNILLNHTLDNIVDVTSDCSTPSSSDDDIYRESVEEFHDAVEGQEGMHGQKNRDPVTVRNVP